MNSNLFLLAGVSLLSMPAAQATAPYFGGAGDGFGVASLYNRELDHAIQESVLHIGSGNGGDGFAAARLSDFQFSPSLDPAAVLPYLAGAGGGDGFDGYRLADFALGGGALPMAHFTGGSGDGFTAQTVLNFSLGPNLPDFAFFGGQADGFDSVGVANFQMEFRIGSPVTFAGLQPLLFTPAEIASGLADATADADGDGVSNLIEFVLGTGARDGGSFPATPPAVLGLEDFGLPEDGNDYLILDVPLSPYAMGVNVGVEFSTNLVSQWDPGILLISTSSRLVARDSQPVGVGSSRFGRVTARLSPP